MNQLFNYLNQAIHHRELQKNSHHPFFGELHKSYEYLEQYMSKYTLV